MREKAIGGRKKVNYKAKLQLNTKVGKVAVQAVKYIAWECKEEGVM